MKQKNVGMNMMNAWTVYEIKNKNKVNKEIITISSGGKNRKIEDIWTARVSLNKYLCEFSFDCIYIQ